MAKAGEARGAADPGVRNVIDGKASEGGRPAQQAQDIVEELAAALARFSETGKAGRPSGANLPAALPINDFEDDFPDDEPVPIPSSWTEAPALQNTGAWILDQTRAAVLGLSAGLLIVVPVVLILTGHVPGLGSIDILARAAAPVAPPAKAVIVASRGDVVPSTLVSETKPSDVIKPRIVATSPIAIPTAPPLELRTEPPRSEPAATQVAAIVTVVPPEPVAVTRPVLTAEQERAMLRSEGQRLIGAGEIAAARDPLARAAAAGDHAAALALGETFDPNMLAAWSVRGISPDVGAARSLYRRALSAGISEAKVRLDALD